MKIYFFVNASAGRVRSGKFISLLREKIQTHKISADIVATRSAEEARRAAEALRADREAILAACGGDGTVHSLVQSLVHSPAALGVIPRGTANDLARAWKIPRNIDQALEILVRGRPASVDVIAAGCGAYIAGAGGIGFDAGVIARAAPWKRRWRGLAPYVPAVILEFLRHGFPAVSLNASGWEYQGRVWQVVFTKISRYGLLLKIGDKLAADDGLMEVCVIPSIPRSRILRRLVSVPVSGLTAVPEAVFVRARSARIASSSFLVYHGDGELMGALPEEFTVIPRALKVMMPG